ncbi:ATP-binding protein [Christiangramia sabulilitoris]|uniref:histidine kinase n=1 Tax=Christiangramia sabulilitoris TaxID=2583991 RepID=A0A550I265_9FLAO|nr:ATP-binding protein [Christiangramia sabulilitoris]TRO65073.1 GAF domain-containing protein [Christiangramia sabulilitoris]
MPRDIYPEKVDLSSCEKEPIHIIGATQDHGLLLACNRFNGKITQVSANSQEIIGWPEKKLLKSNLKSLLGEELSNKILKANSEEDTFPVVEVKIGSETFVAITHSSGESLIVDIEPVQKNENSLDFQKELSEILSTLNNAGTSEDLCRDAVRITRKTFGYDRVMIYKFDEDWNGKVIAEEKNEDMESWLGLHYPASDIPKQARALFLKNKIRIIADVNYTPVKITPEISPINNEPLDLSNSNLRAVSPIHIEYLQNMQVGASLTAALISNGKLWGLLACHHNEARFINYYQRQTCEFLIQIFSNELSVKESQHYLNQIEKYDALRIRLIDQIQQLDNIKKGLSEFPLKITDLLPSSGAAIILNGKIKLVGETPEKRQVKKLFKQLILPGEQNLFSTNNLSEIYPEAKEFQEVASGLLSVRLGRSERDFILWFRPEVIQTVDWGGNPANKATYDRNKERLTPRKSFDKWSEKLTGYSDSWKDHEIAGAGNLSESLSYILLERQKRKIDDLNRQLVDAHEELKLFSQGLSHDLKAPLRGIDGYAFILKEDYYSGLPKPGQRAIDTILSSTREMGELIDNVLSFAGVSAQRMNKQIFSVQHLLEDILQSLNMEVNYPATKIAIEPDLPAMFGDKRMIAQVWSNLITNALKYSENNDRPGIEIGSATVENRTVYFVRDNGVGFDMKYKEDIFNLFSRFSGENFKGTGIGLAIVKKIIEKHEGKIWAESSPGQGSVFYFHV